MAKDIFHETVKAALIKDGWTITHDPLTIQGVGIQPFHIDLGAEKLFAAEKEGVKIAVEVKSFIGKSFAEDFHQAIGQYMNYFIALPNKEPDRVLFMAVPHSIYLSFFETSHVLRLREKFTIHIFTFDTDNQTIVKWIN